MHEQLEYLVANDKLSHAYLFEGQNRNHLKEEALYFASSILCAQNEQCISRVNQLNHADFLLVETSEATIKKEAIEDVLHRMNQKPIEGKYKVYIIMDFDKVTVQGENSILKFLEEPPQNTIAILVTTSPKLILPTIHSRCQHIYFHHNNSNLVDKAHLEIPKNTLITMEQLNLSEEEAIEWYQTHDFNEMKEVIIKWCQSLLNSDTMSLIQIVKVIDTLNTREKQLFGIDLVQLYLQDFMYTLIDESIVSFPDASQLIAQQSSNLTMNQCVKMIDVTLNAKQKLLQYVNVTLVYEQMAIQIVNEVK